MALAAFARDEGIDADPARACWSSTRPAGTAAHELALPEGIDLVFLPAASPELQPAERLWPLVDEPVANRAFADLEAWRRSWWSAAGPRGRSRAPPGPHPLPLVAAEPRPRAQRDHPESVSIPPVFGLRLDDGAAERGPHSFVAAQLASGSSITFLPTLPNPPMTLVTRWRGRSGAARLGPGRRRAHKPGRSHRAPRPAEPDLRQQVAVADHRFTGLGPVCRTTRPVFG